MHRVHIVHQVGAPFPDRLEVHRLHRPQKRGPIRVREFGGLLHLPVEHLARINDQAGELFGLELCQAETIDRVHQDL